MEQQQKQIQIKAKDEDIKGVYSNLMQVVHTKEEFILDFFLASPPQGVLSSRVIMSPGHVKRMLKAFEENLKKYEDKFGKIEEAKAPDTKEEGESKIGFTV
ncbi:DUF3467 domain-containing protein [Candidatus Parcubacteria bacterium]|nr:DUF3467 domain-containing protein [Candidatus Parcubacteria bacterium]